MSSHTSPARSRLLRRAAAPAAIALLLVGCQDAYVEEDPGVGTAVQTESAPTPGLSVPTDAPVDLEAPVNTTRDIVAEDFEVEITMTETFAFDPTFVGAQPGEELAIELVNDDNREHTFTIDELGIDVVVPEQTTQQAGVQLPDSGDLRYYCRFHEFEGMVGAFYAVEDGAEQG